MSYSDLELARVHHAALKTIFAGQGEALRKVEEHCRAASAALDDAYCRETLGIIADYARHIFRERRHQTFLRGQILQALDSLESRFASLEIIRRAAERKAA